MDPEIIKSYKEKLWDIHCSELVYRQYTNDIEQKLLSGNCTEDDLYIIDTLVGAVNGTIPECPNCSIPLVIRHNSKKNNFFWGCRNYGKTTCTHTVGIYLDKGSRVPNILTISKQPVHEKKQLLYAGPIMANADRRRRRFRKDYTHLAMLNFQAAKQLDE